MADEAARDGLRYRDPILFQVLNSAFASITDEMGALVRRAAFSLVVSEGGDYSGTISDREGNLVASGVTDLAAHLGTIPFTVKGTLDWIGVRGRGLLPPRRRRARQRSVHRWHPPQRHARDHARVPRRAGSPPSSRTRCTGRTSAATCPARSIPNARSSYRRGTGRPAGAHRARGRVPVGDGRHHPSQHAPRRAGTWRPADEIGAVRLGERRMQELAAHYGAETIVSAMAELIDYSEQLLREEFRRLPDGTLAGRGARWTATRARTPMSRSRLG